MRKRKKQETERPTKCFSLGATVGHMLALNGEAAAALEGSRWGVAYSAYDILEFEAKEFQRLMGRRLSGEEKKAAKRIQATARTIMKGMKLEEYKQIEVKDPMALRDKAGWIVHDIRSLLEEGNRVCGNRAEAELRAKPYWGQK